MRKKRIVVLLVAVVLLLGQAAAAHQSVDPESTLIPFHMQVLENGLRVIVKEIPSYPIAVANVWVGVGAKDDPDGLSGMAHFFEHLMFQGTPSRPLGQIWQETALLGGDINAATSLDFTFYYIVVPSEHIRQAMEIQADALRNSLFDQAQIDRERQVIQEEISMVRESLQTYLLHSSLQELF
ncbi:MAG TPA: pitrilysin family protein, partial [Limnochordia bacterium]|nr:pitrilysin family protein [Limnochordia bacterium]HPZ80577.1 pitrilysin family protein [Limnochordia bacterium]